ncbi:hypothetical protein PPERSA_02041 [Pseudocohnilembus persalinus]|uniref:Transmembrane protein n=1 Tax=Pseudocohnilembus persalinus TaxID=266149 RepID=A0A0V0QF75_PSEPJ|nr:hypothetical protein PPERSA_02041 [Pseudocohnilembus persalinus]|eukprot:KRX00862.1 hypothetical protein PPERSA_02041 [Pseudocohnilembus persalinus]
MLTILTIKQIQIFFYFYNNIIKNLFYILQNLKINLYNYQIYNSLILILIITCQKNFLLSFLHQTIIYQIQQLFIIIYKLIKYVFLSFLNLMNQDLNFQNFKYIQ